MSGDNSAWPVYLTIGNLNKAKRRGVRENGIILIGLLPDQAKENTSAENKRNFHEALAKILEPLEAPEKDGMTILCADGFKRKCFPRIPVWLADYPEQCLLTLVKQNQWCPRCECPRDKFHELTGTAKIARNLNNYQQMTRAQLERRGVWQLPGVHNFSARHYRCNIFACMCPDRLHQLLKGVLKDHCWNWIKSFLESKGYRNFDTDVDAIFAKIPKYR
jgi:hypothetical protein